MILNTNPIVSICCLCYNHEPYIRECLEGFMMQKTNFVFEVLIHDDASTDKSADIIREYEAKYPEIIKPIYQTENQYSKGIGISITYQFPRARGKYIAMCEGDDYWTDPNKLQKQVDFLEANPEYSLSFHKAKVLSEGVIHLDALYTDLVEGEYRSFEIYDKWSIPTCSVVFRNFSQIAIPREIIYGDIYLFLTVLEQGKAYCHNFDGSVYRRNTGSISANLSIRTVRALFYQYKFMEKRFPDLKIISIRKMNDYLDQLIYAPFFKGIWKFRFYKMLQEPRLFFTSFFTTTLTSYIIDRKGK